MDETNSPPIPCPRCGQPMRPATVKSAIWREDRLFLVEDIPAKVCDSCMEQFYDEETSDALRRLTEDGFSSVEPKREILVPIFSLEGRIRRRASSESEEEVYADY
jgi:YgiT-type zinc finger domain-containing protein